ncbi:unnamed protein product [Pylaiella littoralis]
MEINVKPFKPAAYDALMAFDRKRWAHHAGPADTVIGDQTSSNPVEQNMSMIGAEARKLTPYGLAIAILEKTAQKMAERAELRIGRADRLTPFAAQQFAAQQTQRVPARPVHRERQFHRPQSRPKLRQ